METYIVRLKDMKIMAIIKHTEDINIKTDDTTMILTNEQLTDYKIIDGSLYVKKFLIEKEITL